MSELKKNLEDISQNMINLFVSQTLGKHNVDKTKLAAISDEQKKQLLETVEALKKQADEFLNVKQNVGVKDDEIEQPVKRPTLRDKVREKKKKKSKKK